jgi:membrane fusion protein (multidrug efflux system)
METDMVDERHEETKDAPLTEDVKQGQNGNGNGQESSHTASADGQSAFHKPGNIKLAEEKKNQAEQKTLEQELEDKKESQQQATRNPLFILVAVIAVIALIVWGVRFWGYSQTHVSTDDAYVTGDLVNVSPIIPGTLDTLTVEEGDVVKQGELIAQLDQSGPTASYQQALAAYDAAQTEVPQAKTELAYEIASVNAGISQAQAGLGAQNAKADAAAQQVTLSAATTSNQLSQTQAQFRQAQASARQAAAQVTAAAAQVRNQQQAVETAQRAANAAQAQIAAAQANQVKAARDEARYANLLQQNAVTQEQYDSALAASQSADAQLITVRQQAAQAYSALQQAREEVDQVQGQYSAAQQAAQAAQQQVQVASAGEQIAFANLSQVGVQRSNLLNNQALAQQNSAELTAAHAETQNIQLKKQQVLTAISQANQSAAALRNAKVTLNDTVILAPSDGTVVRKGANVGDSLSPGQTIVTMTRGDYVWVSANFKETQLQNVKPGQSAEVEVDAMPGVIFNGYVKSINEASGNATALLPADNATGNFTKVVQRIPVRIELKPSNGNGSKYATADQIAQLRQGMSVEATIDTSSK